MVVEFVMLVVDKRGAVRPGPAEAEAGRDCFFVQIEQISKLGYETDSDLDVPLLLHHPRHLHSSFVLI